MPTLEHPSVDEQMEIATPNYTKKDYENFIKKMIEKPTRPVTRTTMCQITDSYWRINLWGKKENSRCMFGDNEILLSKFIRVDIDNDGKMVYNDVSEGKQL